MKMTLDSLNRADLLNLLNTICQKEQRSSDLKYQYVQLNNSLSNFRPKKVEFYISLLCSIYLLQ